MSELTFWPPGALAKHDFGIPRFLVDPIIPSEGLVLLHGKREAGKTQLALTLALAVTSGTPFLGLYPTAPGSALLLQVDMPALLTQDRIRQNPDFDRIAILTSPTKVDVVSLKISPPAALKAAQATKPTIVIIDSLRKIHDNDEIDSSAPTNVYSACRELFPGSTLVLLHHDRKTDGVVTNATDDEAFRGSGAWLDDADTGLHLVRGPKRTGEPHTATLLFSKLRTCGHQPTIALRMRSDTLVMERADKTAQQFAMEYLMAHPAAKQPDIQKYLIDTGLVQKSQANRIANIVLGNAT